MHTSTVQTQGGQDISMLRLGELKYSKTCLKWPLKNRQN